MAVKDDNNDDAMSLDVVVLNLALAYIPELASEDDSVRAAGEIKMSRIRATLVGAGLPSNKFEEYNNLDKLVTGARSARFTPDNTLLMVADLLTQGQRGSVAVCEATLDMYDSMRSELGDLFYGAFIGNPESITNKRGKKKVEDREASDNHFIIAGDYDQLHEAIIEKCDCVVLGNVDDVDVEPVMLDYAKDVEPVIDEPVIGDSVSDDASVSDGVVQAVSGAEDAVSDLDGDVFDDEEKTEVYSLPEKTAEPEEKKSLGIEITSTRKERDDEKTKPFTVASAEDGSGYVMRAFVCGLAEWEQDTVLRMDEMIDGLEGCLIYYTERDMGELISSKEFQDYFTEFALETVGGYDRLVVGTRAKAGDGDNARIVESDNLSKIVSLARIAVNPEGKIGIVYDSERQKDELVKLEMAGLIGQVQKYSAEGKDKRAREMALRAQSRLAVIQMIYEDGMDKVKVAREMGVKLAPTRIVEFEMITGLYDGPSLDDEDLAAIDSLGVGVVDDPKVDDPKLVAASTHDGIFAEFDAEREANAKKAIQKDLEALESVPLPLPPPQTPEPEYVGAVPYPIDEDDTTGVVSVPEGRVEESKPKPSQPPRSAPSRTPPEPESVFTAPPLVPENDGPNFTVSSARYKNLIDDIGAVLPASEGFMSDQYDVYASLAIRFTPQDEARLREAVVVTLMEHPLAEEHIEQYFAHMKTLGDKKGDMVSIDSAVNLLGDILPNMIRNDADEYVEQLRDVVDIALLQYTDGGHELLSLGHSFWSEFEECEDGRQVYVAKLLKGLAKQDVKTATDRARAVMEKSDDLNDKIGYLHYVVEECNSRSRWGEIEDVADFAYEKFASVQKMGSHDDKKEAGEEEEAEKPEQTSHDLEDKVEENKMSKDKDKTPEYDPITDADKADSIGTIYEELHSADAEDAKAESPDDAKLDAKLEVKPETSAEPDVVKKPKKSYSLKDELDVEAEKDGKKPKAPKVRTGAEGRGGHNWAAYTTLAAFVFLVGGGVYTLSQTDGCNSGTPSGLEAISDDRAEAIQGSYKNVPADVASALAGRYKVQTLRTAEPDEDGYNTHLAKLEKAFEYQIPEVINSDDPGKIPLKRLDELIAEEDRKLARLDRWAERRGIGNYGDAGAEPGNDYDAGVPVECLPDAAAPDATPALVVEQPAPAAVQPVVQPAPTKIPPGYQQHHPAPHHASSARHNKAPAPAPNQYFTPAGNFGLKQSGVSYGHGDRGAQ